MELDAFVQAARQRVDGISSKYGLTDHNGFIVWASTLLWDELSEDEAVESLHDRINDKKIDLFWNDGFADRIVIIQGKYSSGSGDASSSLSELQAFSSCLNWLADPDALHQENLHDLADVAEEYLTLRSQDIPVELWYLHFGPVDENMKKESEMFNKNPDHVSQHVEMHIQFLPDLKLLFEEVEGGSYRIEKDELKLDSAFLQKGSYGRSLVATVPGSELARLYDVHQNRLFDRNVRLYLGQRKGSVNAGISETLADADRSNFWAYNNGITIVCDEFDFDEKLKDKVCLRNFSIVNGCQTTVSLHRNKNHLPGGVQVLAKIISPENEIVDSIIQFTNSQNKIRVWDIKSQDRTQKRLAQEMTKLGPPWFYAKRKGEFQTLSPDRKKLYRDGEGNRIIKYDTVAQYLAAFNGYSYVAYKFKGKLFDTHYEHAFPPDLGAKKVIFVWQLGELIRDKVREAIKKANEAKDEFRSRILKKGARIYAIAAVEVVLRLRNGGLYGTKLYDGNPWGSKRREKLEKYVELGLVWYVNAVEDSAQGKDLNVLVRQETHITNVCKAIERRYEELTVAPKFLEEALPKLTE